MKLPAKHALVLLVMSAVVLAWAAFSWARALGHRERAMRDEEASSVRLVTYLLRPGESLRVPVDPGTDVIRVVAHAFRRGALGAAGHAARWSVGSAAQVEVIAPGTTARASAEELGVAIGDPVAFNLDARERAPEFLLALDSVADADGMLLRLYRRETLGADQLRRDTVSFTKREHLAARSGELDWVDLLIDERALLLGARWEKVAPLPSSGHPLEALAIELSPSQAGPSVPLAQDRSLLRVPLSVHMSDVPHAETTTVEYDRIAPGHPAIVQALDAPLVLRVQVRRALSGSEASASLGMLVDISQDGRTLTSKPDAQARPSSPDADDLPVNGEEPPERMTFYVLIPARGRAVLRATVTALDVALAELDQGCCERRFVSRRPTNWRVFGALDHGFLRLARRAPPVARTGSSHAPLTRVARPRAVAVTKAEGLTFISALTAIPFESRGASEKLSLRVVAERPTDVHVLIDGGEPRRRRSGVAGSVTTGRVIHVNGESRISFALGDDLEPGRHSLSFETGGVACSIHLPWAKRARAEPETTWLSGELEP